MRPGWGARLERARVWLQRQPAWVADGGLALAVGALNLVVALSAPGYATATPGRPPGVLLAVVVALVASLPLAWRRVAPAAVVVVLAVGELGGELLGVISSGAGLLVGVYTVAAWCSRRTATAVVAGLALVVAGGLLALDALEAAVLNGLLLGGAWLLGAERRAHQARSRELQRRGRELERLQAQRGRLAAQQERDTIAHELHDVIAHGLSAMVAQARGAEQLLTEGDQQGARHAAEQVAATGRDNLLHVRRLAKLLRHDAASTSGRHVGLDELRDVLRAYRAAGVDLEWSIDEALAGLPRPVELVAAGLACDAVHTLMRDPQPYPVRVSIAGRAHQVHVTVQQDTPQTADEDTLAGLRSVAQRAAALSADVRLSRPARLTATLAAGQRVGRVGAPQAVSALPGRTPRARLGTSPARTGGVALAGLVGGVELVVVLASSTAPFPPAAAPAPRPWALVLVLAAVLPLVWRQRAPRAVLAATGVAGGALMLSASALLLAPPIAMYTLARLRPAVQAWRWLTVLLLGALGLAAVTGSWAHGAVVLAMLSTAASLGALHRWRAAHDAALQVRAAQLAADHERVEQLAVVAERLRVARDLHDVLARGLSVMVVQATGASGILSSDPNAAADALGQVQAVGQANLRELRALLGLLGSEQGALQPQPGLEMLDELIADARDADVDAHLHIRGEVRPVDAGVALTAFRIAEEALTNVRKHAGPTETTLELIYRPDALVVRVADAGPRPAPGSEQTVGIEPDGGGLGLVSMRERAGLVGGALRTQPTDAGGFLVEATLPTQRTFHPAGAPA